MHSIKIIVIAGFAMFCMFFGSGNLVFPLLIGTQAGNQYLIASLGLFITGVAVPFLGLWAMILYKGDIKAFFGELGKIGGFFVPLVALCLMGPFGVIPRCSTVALGGFTLVYPNASPALFSAAFMLSIVAIVWKKKALINVIGKFLTPLLLLGVGIIIGWGIYKRPINFSDFATGWVFNNRTHTCAAFKVGFITGYQTMDLLAAFFFARATIQFLQAESKINPKPQVRLNIASSLLGLTLLGAIYIGLVYLGAAYAPELEDIAPNQLLITVAHNILGRSATFITSITIILACVTTAAALASLFAEFVHQRIFQKKWLSEHLILLFTLGIAFVFSIQGFGWISSFLGMLLEKLYPALIAFTSLAIFKQSSSVHLPKYALKAAFIGALCISLGLSL
jgi:LIVCS family branched-chain amino acid:cation transporter